MILAKVKLRRIVPELACTFMRPAAQLSSKESAMLRKPALFRGTTTDAIGLILENTVRASLKLHGAAHRQETHRHQSDLPLGVFAKNERSLRRLMSGNMTQYEPLPANSRLL